MDSEMLEDEEEETAPLKEDTITVAERMDLWKTEKPENNEEESHFPKEKQERIPPPENIPPWSTDKPIMAPDDNHATLDQIATVEADEDGEDFVITQYPEAWQFLTCSHAYYWLLSRVRSEMLLSKREYTAADNIRRDILRGLASQPKKSGYGQLMSKEKFEIPWALPKFLRDNYSEENIPKLSSLITLSASGDDVQALTCGQYMSQVWPVTGQETLGALQEALDKGIGQAYKGVSNLPITMARRILTDFYVVTTTDETRITFEINKSTVFAVIKGTEPAIAEIGQQLAWLGAAFRSSPSNRMAYSTPRVMLSAAAETAFALDFRITEVVDSGLQRNGSCWRSLFRNPIIVEGYPILARTNGEEGLEIPLNMMAGLGQASRVTNFDGGLVIKGHSNKFLPAERIKNSVLWHYVFNLDGSRMSYSFRNNLGGGRASIHEVDNPCLEYSRNFLGWTSSAELYTGEVSFTLLVSGMSSSETTTSLAQRSDCTTTQYEQGVACRHSTVLGGIENADIPIGTKDVDYSQIDWAGLSFASAGLAFEKFSLVAGNYVNGGVSFTKGSQDVPIHLSNSQAPYILKIHSVGNFKVIMYDVKDRRGWVVDGASALLHLTRTQLASSPYTDSELLKMEEFQHANPRDGVSAAKKALLDPKNRGLLIFKDWTYEDLVESTYHILEQIQDNQVRMMSTSAINLRFTPRDKLIGFGFRDIVNGQSILYPRVATLKPSGRGWVDLTRNINAITLIGRGFGELIRPAQDTNRLCKYWSHVPIGRDYLVACISTLKEIACQHGDRDSDPLELADGIYWHKPDKLYDPCDCKRGSWKLGCERVQVLLPSLSVGSKRHPHPFDNNNGAVIFGRSRRLRWLYPNEGNPVEGGESESESEEVSDFRDSAIGGSSSWTSDPDQSSNVAFSSSETSSEIQDSTMPGALANPENSKTPLTESDPVDAVAPNSELHNSLQIPSRGVKRTFDKVKDTATQIFSRKRQHTSGIELEADLHLQSKGTE